MTTATLQALDKAHVWHPFTAMAEWCAPDAAPLVLERGQGVWLYDTEGHRYFDGNSSIWTNIHGHQHPRITNAIRAQLDRVAHVSFLGATHPPAIELATALVGHFPPDTLTRVFFSDDGSTAVECALRLAWQFWEWQGHPHRRTFIAFDQAYHGDTLGAASLGGIPHFSGTAGRLGLPVHHVPDVAALEALSADQRDRIAAVIIEPLIQGAAGMRLWPAGLLREVRRWCDHHGILLIFDEVMTGFGRTGRLFACDHDAIIPDLLCLAKGLTGGYSPLAATLTTDRLYHAFVGPPDERRTFFYGHSYSGHALGCAAAIASWEIFREEHVLDTLAPKIHHLTHCLATLRARHPTTIHTIRQCGFIAGIEVATPPNATRQHATLPQSFGADICHAARPLGLLTRPIGNTLVIMPPLCASPDDITFAINALSDAITTVAPEPH